MLQAFGVALLAIGAHGSMRVPDDLFIDDANADSGFFSFLQPRAGHHGLRRVSGARGGRGATRAAKRRSAFRCVCTATVSLYDVVSPRLVFEFSNTCVRVT